MMNQEDKKEKINFGNLLFKYGQWLHIPVSVLTIILGFSSFLSLSHVRSYFRDQCVLYADIRLTASDMNSLINIDSGQTSWGDPSECDVTIYFTVVATIQAFIWSWFFLMFRLHAFPESHEIFMLDLSVLGNFITFIFLLVTSRRISLGTRHFCSQLEKELKLREIMPNIKNCAETEQFIWSIYQKKQHYLYYSFLETSNVCSWLMAVSVAGQVVLCVYRLYTWNEVVDVNRKSRSVSKKSAYQYDNHVSDDEF